VRGPGRGRRRDAGRYPTAIQALIMCRLEWLRATSESQVAPDTLVVAHGDLRTDNMIFDASGSDVVALLDWELAALGHPLGDLAYLVLPYAIPPLPVGPLSGFKGLHSTPRHGTPLCAQKRSLTDCVLYRPEFAAARASLEYKTQRSTERGHNHIRPKPCRACHPAAPGEIRRDLCREGKGRATLATPRLRDRSPTAASQGRPRRLRGRARGWRPARGALRPGVQGAS